MNALVAKWLTLAAAIEMIVTGLGLIRLIFPMQSDVLHRLEAAGGQLLGFAGLCVIQLVRESRPSCSTSPDETAAVDPHAPEHPHPLAS